MKTKNGDQHIERVDWIARVVGRGFLGLCILIMLLIIPSGSVAAGGPWYVAPGGDDLNDCLSPSSPCATINGTIGKATSGDLIYIAEGTYTGMGEEVVRINKSATLSGGWDAGFSSQSGASTIDGENVRRGIRVDFDSVVVIDHLIIQNGLFEGAPGILTDGSLTLNYSTVKDNFDTGDGTSEGGGIRNGPSTMTLNHSTVQDNTSSSGAGIFNAWGTLILNNSTISGNTASGGGGGINNLGGTVTLNSSTVSNNSADPVGGIHNESGGSVTLSNSIVAGNHAGYGPDCNGTFGSSGYNLIGNSADCAFSPTTGDLTDMDPHLGALQDNGGPTLTHALLAGSSAIDAGTEGACPSTDQRDAPRPLDGDGDGVAECDIGAFEFERQVRLGLVTDEQGVDDNGLNQLAYQGFLEAQTDFGFTGTVYESLNPDDYGSQLAQCAADDELCISVGFLMVDATLAAAQTYPGTAFTGIDIFFFEPPGNLRGVLFAEDEAGYLAGVVGGMMTESDIIGGIGGMQIPPVEAFINGYRSGAMCHNPVVDVLVNYTGTFIDSALGAATAGDMIGQGADVIFAPAGLTGEGAVLAATQAGAWGIGVDTDWYDTVFNFGSVTGADKVLTSAMKLLGNAVYMTIDDYINGAFSPGMVRYGLAEGGVGLAPFHETDPVVPQSVRDALASAEAGIVDGSIDVWDSCQGEPPPELNPQFNVRRLENAIEGWEWEMGVEVTLTIDNLGNGPGVDYVDALIVGPADWDPNQSYVRFEISPPFTIEPGNIVSMDDGTTTKTHVVTNLLVTGLDLDTDVVSGTADPGAWIELWTCDDVTCYHRRAIADIGGFWSADFSVAGSEPDELVYDFTPGTWVDVSEWDDDWDKTFISWNVPDPRISASPNHDWVEGHGWQDDSTINLFIDDDLDLGNGILHSETGYLSPGEGYINFHLQDVFNLEAGQYITMTDGISTHVLQLSSLDVTAVDPGTATVSGIADSGSTVHVWIDACDPPCDTWPTADAAGNWSVSFSGIFEFVPGEWYSSAQYDDDGDETMVPWQVRDPRFEANITGNWISANEFPAHTDVTAYVYETDAKSDLRFDLTLPTDESGHAWFDFWDLGLGELVPGNFVEVVGGGYSKDLTILALTLDVFDPDMDVIAGTAPDGETVRVDACNEIIPDVEWDCTNEEDTAVAGAWSVTFSDFLDSETWFAAFITDDDGDSTMAELPWVPTPYLVASPVHDEIDAWGWELGEILNLLIDDPSTPEDPDFSATTEVVVPDWNPNDVVGMFEFGREYDLDRGHIITISGGGIEKVHEVIHLYVDTIDLATDTVSGTAEPLSEVIVTVDDVEGAELSVEADEFGNWSAEFSSIADLEIGSEGDAKQWDDDGDETQIYWGIVMPRIQAWPDYESIEGFNWPADTMVHLSIEDPVLGEIFTDSQPTEPAEFDPNTMVAVFDLPESVDLMPGHVIEMTDNVMSKTHIVSDVAVTGSDFDTDVVSGTSSTSDEVRVIPHDEWDKEVIAAFDAPGEWSANFSGIFDVDPGAGFYVLQEENDLDATWIDWSIPFPGIAVFDGVEVHDATPDASVTITIYDSEGMLVFGPESRPTDDDGIHNSHYTTLGCHFIKPGDVVEIMDDATGITKSLRVSELQIEVINAEEDIVSGRADPESVFYLHVDDVDGGFGMQVYTDSDGLWTADFGSVGDDIPAVAFAQAWLVDEDGDVTKHQLPNTHSPEYVRVLPFRDGEEYTLCPGQAAKIRWGWKEQSEANVESFLAAIDIHTYSLDGVPIFPSTDASNAQFGLVELNQPNALCGWPTTYVSWFDYDLFDLEPGEHSLASTLHLGQPVPETCGGGEVSDYLWENATVTLNVLPGPNDIDADGVNDDIDNCPGVPNLAQADFNQNGKGDKCDDEAIDIWPYLARNIVYLGRDHTIPVAILSSEAFGAFDEVDRSSLTFGRTGSEESLKRCLDRTRDLNGDGLEDLLCFFSNAETDFEYGDSEGVLMGQTIDGVVMRGADSVVVVRSWRERSFKAHLTGAKVIPPVETDAYAFSSFRLNWSETRITYGVYPRYLDDVTAITLHCGTEGENGPVGATLYSGDPVSKWLYWRRLSAPDDGDGNLCGWTDFPTMVAALRSGDTYISVQTVDFPQGEIRGQITLARR